MSNKKPFETIVTPMVSEFPYFEIAARWEDNNYDYVFRHVPVPSGFAGLILEVTARHDEARRDVAEAAEAVRFGGAYDVGERQHLDYMESVSYDTKHIIKEIYEEMVLRLRRDVTSEGYAPPYQEIVDGVCDGQVDEIEGGVYKECEDVELGVMLRYVREARILLSLEKEQLFQTLKRPQSKSPSN